MLDQFFTTPVPEKMNNTVNATSISNAAASEFIQEIYSGYVLTLVYISMTMLFFYSTVSAFPREVEYVWLSPRPFSIPNLLYAFTRYGNLISQALDAYLNLAPVLGSLCNSLDIASTAMSCFGFIGIQGLLIARAYSICSGNRTIAGVFGFFFSGGLILYIYSDVIYGGCSQSSYSAKDRVVSLAVDICVVSTDLLVFCICLWKVWGTWRLKRDLNIKGNNDLVSILLRQTVSRFCFVITMTFTTTILTHFANDPSITILTILQNSFSAILLANFTLDLRQRNSVAILTTNATLPSLRFQSVGNYIHESILVELGDNPNAEMRERGDGDDSSRTPDVDIGSGGAADDQSGEAIDIRSGESVQYQA